MKCHGTTIWKHLTMISSDMNTDIYTDIDSNRGRQISTDKTKRNDSSSCGSSQPANQPPSKQFVTIARLRSTRRKGSEYVTISVRFYILLVILVLFSCQFVSEQMATGRHNNTDEMCTFRLLPLILIVINSKRNGYRLISLHFYPSISVLASLIVPVDMEYVWVGRCVYGCHNIFYVRILFLIRLHLLRRQLILDERGYLLARYFSNRWQSLYLTDSSETNK